MSLVSAGMGVPPMTVAPIAARLVTMFDWRFSQLLIGFAVWALLMPVAFLVRRAPAMTGHITRQRPAGTQLNVREALTSPQFLTS